MITWEAKKEQIFEMPTGGSAIMRQGPNLLKLARKEQCMALTTQLRTKFKASPVFYRVFPNGEVQYLHPKDGVYPEKVNAGRQGANQNMRRIGQNGQPVNVKFTGVGTFGKVRQTVWVVGVGGVWVWVRVGGDGVGARACAIHARRARADAPRACRSHPRRAARPLAAAACRCSAPHSLPPDVPRVQQSANRIRPRCLLRTRAHAITQSRTHLARSHQWDE